MRILKIEISNFRSIQKLSVDTNRAQVIFQGPNDAGKSSILLPIDLVMRQTAHMLWPDIRSVVDLRDWTPDFPSDLSQRALIRRGSEAAEARLLVQLDTQECAQVGLPSGSRLGLGARWTSLPDGRLKHEAFSLATGAQYFAINLNPNGSRLADFPQKISRLLASAVQFVNSNRIAWPEVLQTGNKTLLPAWSGQNLKQILFAYKNSSQPTLQARFEQLRRLCAEPDVPIGDLSVGIDGANIFVRTIQGDLVLDIEDRSSGIRQLVFLFALAMCHSGSILVVEEPELNLAPNLQRVAWTKLASLAGQGGPLQQVIISSHSHIFEVDAERIAVFRTAGGTAIKVQEPVVSPEPNFLTLTVASTGELILNPDLLKQLSVPGGGTVYARATDGQIQLLSRQVFGRVAAGDAEG